MKVSKAMEDVWEWKQAVYEDIRDMDTQQRQAYFRAARERLEAETGGKLGLRTIDRAPRRRG